VLGWHVSGVTGTEPTDPTEPRRGPWSSTEWGAANKAWWDERAPIHIGSEFYDVEGFVADPSATHLRPFEIAEVGDVTDRTLVHAQCHFGLDTLSWARRGARVTGLDFSVPAIETARLLAERMGVDAEFVAGDVYDAVELVGGRTFDIVYTGFGAIAWLPDIQRWAQVMAALASPGGMLYLAEFHPVHHVFGDDDLTVEHPYFQEGPQRWDEPGTYADLDAQTAANVTYEWTHGLGDVVTALAAAGLAIELLHELDHTLFPRWPFLVHDAAARTYRLPAGMPSLPLMYTIRARKPA
jgi:2-polyprenyl-3-methyl-5-hydroxy-6-metoxy-1,4-benzoquinol methylase